MTIISTTFVVSLLALVAVATLTGVVLVGGLLANRLAFHHRARVSRHESVRSYYGHLAFGH